MSDQPPRRTSSPADPAGPTFERNAAYAPTVDNRPVPLERGRLPLARERGSQMSFGERAALEGVLAQLRPSLSLEIGTAEGGSLARIAAYSSEVHSIDIDHQALSCQPPAHVVLHTGDSAELLRPLLASFEDTGRLLEFALVDGDHSFDGVRNDVISLLESPACRQSVILVHDTLNAEVRAGVESVPLEDYPNVVYYEPEFVPGYVYRNGECRGAVWGGIGLLITDTDRSPRYPLPLRQSRYVELFGVIHRAKAELLSDVGPTGSDPDPAS